MEAESYFYNIIDLADKLGVTQRAVRLWANNGKIPQPIRITRRAVRWYWPDVVEYLTAAKKNEAAAKAKSQSVFAEQMKSQSATES